MKISEVLGDFKFLSLGDSKFNNLREKWNQIKYVCQGIFCRDNCISADYSNIISNSLFQSTMFTRPERKKEIRQEGET